jgi:5-(carboxyamino)imidazole ribonucleotide synthase
VIEAGTVLGVLGGGQLGAMFAEAAQRLGYEVAVWDPDADAPAHRIVRYSFPRSFADRRAFEAFTDLVSVVTYEWENIPWTLCQNLEQLKPLRPSSAVLKIIQDRIVQKDYLRARGFPVPRYAAVRSPEHLSEAVAAIGFPAICKTATAGYDGKGQWKLRNESELIDVREEIRSACRQGIRLIVESFVPFERELSVLVVRGSDGSTVVYPVAENEHEDGILRTTVVPAGMSSMLATRIGELAKRVVDQLDGVGVFCLELFELSGEQILINEIAPRPHNSGHYTLDACSVSQFEQQVRSIRGLPLGEARLSSPAVMINLIGDEVTRIAQTDCRALIASPGAVLHLYGKRTLRPRRKMGHVTFLDSHREAAKARALQLQECLAKSATA